MTFNKYKSLLAAGAIALMTACTTEVEDFAASGGVAEDGSPIDYSTYVALGNSLSSGVSDGAWIAASQNNSYPQLIANSLQQAGLGAKDFNQPSVGIQAPYFGAPLILTNQGPCFDCSTPQGPTSNIYTEYGGFHNMAVPGIRAVDMTVAGYGQVNTNFGYFQSSDATSVLADAAAMNATFFSMWLGANDVLGFATSGGSKGTNDIMQATAITPLPVFKVSITAVLNTMTANGAKGVVLNIPDITEAAVFNTVPAAMVVDEGTANTVNALLASMLDPQIQALFEAERSTIQQLITPNPLLGGANFTAYALSVLAGEGVTEPTSVEIATKIVYLQVYQGAIDGGMTPDQANGVAQAYLLTQTGKTAVSGLVSLGINTSWAVMTGTDEEVNTIISTATTNTIAALKVAKQYPVFVGGSNMLPVMDATSATGILTPEEGTLFNLTALPKLTMLEKLLTGELVPDPDFDLEMVLPVINKGEVLLAEDVAAVKQAIEGYNTFLKEQADDRGLAYVDTKSVMSEAAQGGIIIDGVTYTTDYLSGNLFSLDGAHLTQRGYAVIGNYTIQAINAKYGAKIPQIQQNDFPVVETTPVGN